MDQKRNIVFFLSDDHGAWAMGCAGNEELRTPNLDRLARQGTRMDNCFCVSPVCSPARASIMTGKIPSQHGVHDWLAKGHLDSEEAISEPMKQAFADPDAPMHYRWCKDQLSGDTAVRYLDGHCTYTQVLADAGYECAISGKWHMGDSYHPQAGFSYWKTAAMGGDLYYYPVMLKDGKMDVLEGQYITDVIADNAIDFLNNRNQEKPFYLSVHFTAPHSPWGACNHPGEYIDLYKDCPFTSTPNVPPHPWAPHARRTKAEWDAMPHDALMYHGAHYGPIPDTWQEYRRESLTGYYAAISAMDAAVGRVLNKLEADGLLENTLIVFTGDNGMSMGHHGIFGKGNGTSPVNMYDSAVKVPSLFCLPGVVKSDYVCDQMVSHYDFFETLLEVAGVPFEKPADMPGTSFVPLLTGQKQQVRDAVVVYDEYGPCRMIRTKEWKLIIRIPYGPNELYDLVNDPEEESNKYGDPAYSHICSSLAAGLESWFRQYVDPALDGSKETVTGSGQITSHEFQ